MGVESGLEPTPLYCRAMRRFDPIKRSTFRLNEPLLSHRAAPPRYPFFRISTMRPGLQSPEILIGFVDNVWPDIGTRMVGAEIGTEPDTFAVTATEPDMGGSEAGGKTADAVSVVAPKAKPTITSKTDNPR
jgi:hypothetical protein